jgi:hypothetical protein
MVNGRVGGVRVQLPQIRQEGRLQAPGVTTRRHPSPAKERLSTLHSTQDRLFSWASAARTGYGALTSALLSLEAPDRPLVGVTMEEELRGRYMSFAADWLGVGLAIALGKDTCRGNHRATTQTVTHSACARAGARLPCCR